MPLVALTAAAMTLASASTLAATVYKWTDERGVVHYSDQPHPEAKEMDVKPAPTVSSVPPPSSTSRPSSSAPTGPAYSTCSFSRPENDEVFLNTDTMAAALRLEPQLRSGHQAIVTLDGQRLPGQSPTSTSFVISSLTRGTHTLAVSVQDESGSQVCSGSVTFHVRQPSVQAPVRSTRPKF